MKINNQLALFKKKCFLNTKSHNLYLSQTKKILPEIEKNGFCVIEDISNEEYHGGIGFSSSNIKSSPGTPLDLERFKYKFLRVEEKKKKCLSLGDILHQVLLEDKKLENLVIDEDLFQKAYATKAVKAEAESFKTEGKVTGLKYHDKDGNQTKTIDEITVTGLKEYKKLKKSKEDAGLTFLGGEEIALIKNMVKKTNEDEELSNCIKEGHKEVAVYWYQQGLLMKAKIDLFLGNMIVDLKTSIMDLDTFERQVFSYEYALSACLYAKALSVAFGYSSPSIMFVIFSKTYPSRIDKITLVEGNPILEIYDEIINNRLASIHGAIERTEYPANESTEKELEFGEWRFNKIASELNKRKRAED